MEAHIKTPSEIEHMKEACRITGDALKVVEEKIRAGMTTMMIDNIVRDYIHSCNAKCSFKNYQGYPGNACVSINDEIVHGIPSAHRIIEEGDIVSVDVGAYKNGFHGDAARTFMVGNVSKEAKRLVEVTRQAFFEGIKYAKPGNRIGDVCHAIGEYVHSQGYSVVREFQGHGIRKRYA